MSNARNPSFLEWLHAKSPLPWWFEYGALFITIVLIGRAHAPIGTMIAIFIAYLVGMQLLRMLVQSMKRRRAIPR